MKFIKNVKLNKHNIHLNINSKFKINKNGLIFFGNPIFSNINKINQKNVKKYIHEISGVYLCLIIKKENIYIYNDVGGNFRVYFRKIGKNYFITDNFNYLLKKKINLDKEQLTFWKNKNYTIGSKTLFKEVKKIPPSSISYFVNNEFIHQIYFNSNNLKINGNLKTILKKCLDKNLKNLKSKKNKNILLFSGGKDSSLIAQYLVRNKINFIPVILNTNPKIFELEINKTNAINIAKKNKLNLFSVDIDLYNINESTIINSMLFDFHFSILHFEGIKKIKKIFGKNINIICGQTADSIFSFGATANTFSHLISRISYVYNNFLLASLVKQLLQLKYKTQLQFSNIKKEDLFFFSFYYYLFVEKELFSKTLKTRKIINKLKSKLSNEKDYLMYLKIFGFIQGSDNQVLINSCKKYNANILMPYLDPQLIYGIIKKKNNLKDIFFPKYPIIELLEESYLNKKVNYVKSKNISNFSLKKIELDLKNKFLKKIKSLYKNEINY